VRGCAEQRRFDRVCEQRSAAGDEQVVKCGVGDMADASGRDEYTDTATGMPVGNVTRYTCTDGEEPYVVTFTRHSDLAAAKFIDDLKGLKKAAAKLAGFDGAYLRFAGELRIDHHEGERLVESHTDDALWELMYFGKARS